MEKEMIGTATYSPEDNKLRLYPFARLDAETYQRVKAAGFSWAPKQDLFVAPMWTPGREDILIELCGEIGDEDKSLVDRAEERAERFEEYSDKREEEAERAHAAVDEVAKRFEGGQPILVGHHSERRARKDAERIENGMRKALDLWKTSKYWEQRAAGAIHHAKYKERPDVRARRIKGIEADKRKAEKIMKESNQLWKFWRGELANKSGQIIEVNRESALHLCNYYDHTSRCFPLDQYPRQSPASQYEGSMSLWSALGGSDGPEHMVCTVEQARDIAITRHARTVEHYTRWITHYENRLIYEKAMLGEQGASELLAPKPRPKQLPLCNYRAPEGFIMIPNRYNRGELEKYIQVEMTKEQYNQVPADYKGGKEVENSHRVRVCIGCYIPGVKNQIEVRQDETERFNITHRYYTVFLTDSKVHEKPEPAQNEKPEPRPRPTVQHMFHAPNEKDVKIEQLRGSIKAGVQVVSAPQLFPTPPEIAEKMADLAELEPGLCVLEPSAGTGNLIKAVLDRVDTEVLAYEINQGLCSVLERAYPSYKLQVRWRDFLEVTEFQGQYPRILMNPPFENGSDIKHINHARKFLAPGGKLVALCANGPRQREAFMGIADYWEDLPAGSFKSEGTGVNVALMVLTSPVTTQEQVSRAAIAKAEGGE